VALIDRAEAVKTAQTPPIKFNPYVDILFVFDNSDSMKKHAAAVAKEIDKFTAELQRHDVTDFHIGITFVYDRTLPQFCGPQTKDPGHKVYNDSGSLEVLSPALGERHYVTRQDDFVGIIRAKLLDKDFIPTFIPFHENEPTVCAQGPEREESAKPMLDALRNPALSAKGGPNYGFRRPGAAFVAILVSDAKDEAITDGKISVDQVIAELQQAAGSTPQKKLARIFAVAVKPGSVQHGPLVGIDGHLCKPDPAFQVRVQTKSGFQDLWPSSRTIEPADSPLAQLAMATEDKGDKHVDQVMSICDPNYGETLARYGAAIEQQAIEDIVIPLERPPQEYAPGSKEQAEKGLAVFLGGVELPTNVWSPEIIDGRYAVTIKTSQINWKKFDRNSEFTVRFTPVDPNGRDARRSDQVRSK
jgi:hypothetical protein